MPGYLLDTNIVSFILKNHPEPIRRFQQAPQQSVVLSAIVEAELRYGAARLPPTARLHSLLADFLARAHILGWDSLCARHYAALRASLEAAGQSLALADTMIAAHALALDLTLVTNDQAFTRIPALRVEDWTAQP